MALLRTTTDRLFLRFCRTGDPNALGQVFDRTAAELLRVACYLCGNGTDAEDLVQRTFLAAIESRTSYDPKRRAMPWLLGILANHQRRLLRERQRPSPVVGDSLTEDPALAAAQRELDETLTQLRSELLEPYREVLRLHLEQGLNAKEIAATLQRPAGTVRTQLMRALDLLRQRLPNGFVAAMVPWLPCEAGLVTVRSTVLQAVCAGNASTVAGASIAAAGTVVGGMWMSQKLLIAVPVLFAALSLTGYLLWSPGSKAPATFSMDPDVRTVVTIDESWADDAIDQIAAARAKPETRPKTGPETGSESVATKQASGPVASKDSWWTNLPRTGASTYESFVLLPSSVRAKDLLRNEVLNRGDVPIDRDVAESFLSYYVEQARLVSMARELITTGRMRLVCDLLANKQLAVVNIDSIRGKTFKLKNGELALGDKLLEMARSSLGEAANEESLTMTALSMAGIFDAGDTFTFAEGRTYLLPFERLEEGIPKVISVERSVTLELVVAVHGWFHALGTLPNAEELVLQLTPKILDGRR